MAEVTYYFDVRGSAVWTDADNMIDNVLSTFASTTVDEAFQYLNGNTCPGTNLGTITKVDLRAYAYGDGNDQLILKPFFGVFVGGDYVTIPAASEAWGVYVDITNDGNAPSPWTWNDIVTLNTHVRQNDVAKGNTTRCAKVEIRVTYTPSGSSYYHGLKVQGVGELALCDAGTHPLRIRKGGTTYGIELVATDDPNASALRIKTGAGIKAIRKYT